MASFYAIPQVIRVFWSCSVIVMLSATLAVSQHHRNDQECTEYNHADYGYTGQCVPYSDCPGDKYITGLCPDYPWNVKCCFTAPSDERCTSNRGWINRGRCMDKDQCPYGNYAFTNLCRNAPANIKCCYSQPEGECPGIRIVTRSEWQASPASSKIDRLERPVDHAFIHHTTGDTCNSVSSCSRIVKGIQDYHMSGEWNDIAYSFLVGGDGNIYEGRGWDLKGGHTKGYNDNGLAWAFIGEFTDTLPNKYALANAKIAIACARRRGKLSDTYYLHGHRDSPYSPTTVCPGNALYNEITTWPRYRENVW